MIGDVENVERSIWEIRQGQEEITWKLWSWIVPDPHFRISRM